MTTKIIYQPSPIDLTTAHIHSDLEWGNDKQDMLTFIIEDGLIISADNALFGWAVGVPLKMVEDYIMEAERWQIEQQMINRESFTKSQRNAEIWCAAERKREAIRRERWHGFEVGDIDNI